MPRRQFRQALGRGHLVSLTSEHLPSSLATYIHNLHTYLLNKERLVQQIGGKERARKAEGRKGARELQVNVCKRCMEMPPFKTTAASTPSDAISFRAELAKDVTWFRNWRFESQAPTSLLLIPRDEARMSVASGAFDWLRV